VATDPLRLRRPPEAKEAEPSVEEESGVRESPARATGLKSKRKRSAHEKKARRQRDLDKSEVEKLQTGDEAEDEDDDAR
jgi:hypothetical protein